jgi:HAD superfamily hydrolase (TIGR01509 family)
MEKTFKDNERGVLFDFNGTLLFDTPLHCEAWKRISEEIRGHPFTTEEFEEKINGMPNKAIIKYLNPNATEEEVNLYIQKKEDLYKQLLLESNLQLADGAIELFEYLKKHNIKYTIATSSGIENITLFIERYNLAKWFDVDKIVYNNNTFKGKPHPDIYLIAANKIGVDIKNCIIFEDTKNGVLSGEASGAYKVIGITSSNSKEDMLKMKGCVHAIENYKNFDYSLLN